MNKTKELRKEVNLNTLNKNEKKIKLRDLYVHYPQTNEIIDALEFAKEHSKYYQSPQCICIVGESGVGKSRLCSVYTSKHPTYEIELEDRFQKVTPILYALVEPTATIKTMATSLLRALNDPFYSKGRTTVDLTYRLTNLIKDCRVEMIILDEVQHIYDKDSQKILQSASNWIKNLVTHTQLPIVLVGLPDVLQVIQANDQLVNRFKYRFHIKGFSLETIDDRQEFRSFLHMVDLKLPLEKRSNLAEPDMVKMLYEGSNGNARTLMEQIIITAAIKAIDSNMPALTKEVLSKEIDKLKNTIEYKQAKVVSYPIKRTTKVKSAMDK